MTNLSKNQIQNIDNYNITFQNTSIDIFTKYMLIINEYLKHFIDNIYIQNPIYYNYILKRGITTINHVFKILLIYTKNLDIVYYNCQKSYIYYIEFIGQIGEDNHTFLQLNSKDASLFVYKKTIFDINNDIRKDYISDIISNKLLHETEEFIQIYNYILSKFFENYPITTVIKYVNCDLHNTMQKIIKLYIDNSITNISSKINAILIFSTYFLKDNILDYLDIFIKKIKKKSNINIIKLKQMLLDEELINNPPVKYITLIMHQI
jgi:hypothetical protein